MIYPDRYECFRLLKEYGTPDRVVRHCMAVRDAALAAAGKVKAALPECPVDTGLLEAACLLHDIARVEEKHELAGSRYLRSLGYDDVADIVAKHMTYSDYHDIKDADETDFLCLGDRVVKEDRYVGPEERMQYVLDKALKSGNAGAADIVREKKKLLFKFIGEIEDACGMSIDEICGSAVGENDGD